MTDLHILLIAAIAVVAFRGYLELCVRVRG